MEEIRAFLSNPVVGLIGYVFSLIAACIAIWQFRGKASALQELETLKMEITNMSEVNNRNNIKQGKKSQYFQDNSGSVHIDNRD
jgi:hypothetical protein